MWIPTNIKTGIAYPPITDSEKSEWEKDPNIAGKYRFAKAPEARPKPLEPFESKKASEDLGAKGI